MATAIGCFERNNRTFDTPVDSVRTPKASLLRRGWRFLMDGLVQSVPEEDALCEFDCRKPQCGLDEWLTCERRLQAVAAQARFAGRAEPAPIQLSPAPTRQVELRPGRPSLAPSSPDCVLTPAPLR
jgi:hypothetical protein